MWYNQVVRRVLTDMLPVSTFFLDLPKMDKIVCHIGVGSGTEKRSHVLRPMVLLTLLTGQKSYSLLIEKSSRRVSFT